MLTLFHDYTSPASAVAVARLQRLADEGLAMRIAGLEVAAIDLALPVTADVLAELDGLQGQARAEGVVLRRPSRLPPTGAAHTVEAHAAARDLAASWRAAAYRALWEDDADLADPAVLRTLAAGAGLDPVAVERLLADRAALAGQRRAMAAHRRDGVGGVPTIRAHHTLVPGLLAEADLRALAVLA